MARYIAAGGWTDDNWDVGEPMRPDISVDAEKRADTGLIDLYGRKIYRLADPIGFGREGEQRA